MTDEQIKQGLGKAYKEAGHNAYFGNGFEAGVRFSQNELSEIEFLTKKLNKRSIHPEKDFHLLMDELQEIGLYFCREKGWYYDKE